MISDGKSQTKTNMLAESAAATAAVIDVTIIQGRFSGELAGSPPTIHFLPMLANMPQNGHWSRKRVYSGQRAPTLRNSGRMAIGAGMARFSANVRQRRAIPAGWQLELGWRDFRPTCANVARFPAGWQTKKSRPFSGRLFVLFVIGRQYFPLSTRRYEY